MSGSPNRRRPVVASGRLSQAEARVLDDLAASLGVSRAYLVRQVLLDLIDEQLDYRDSPVNVEAS